MSPPALVRGWKSVASGTHDDSSIAGISIWEQSIGSPVVGVSAVVPPLVPELPVSAFASVSLGSSALQASRGSRNRAMVQGLGRVIVISHQMKRRRYGTGRGWCDGTYTHRRIGGIPSAPGWVHESAETRPMRIAWRTRPAT